MFQETPKVTHSALFGLFILTKAMKMRSTCLAGSILALCGAASAFIPSASLKPALRLGAGRSTSTRLVSLPKLSKGLRMTLAMPPMGELQNLDGKIPDCPVTIWNAEKIDIAAEQVLKIFCRSSFKGFV